MQAGSTSQVAECEAGATLAFSPVTLLSLHETPVAVVKTAKYSTLLPFDVSACKAETLSTQAQTEEALSRLGSLNWRLQAKATLSLSREAAALCWVVVSAESSTKDVCLPVSDTSPKGIDALEVPLARSLNEAFPDSSRAHHDLRIFIMNEPNPSVEPHNGFPVTPSVESMVTPRVNERVFYADTTNELAHLIQAALREHYVGSRYDETVVCWPQELSFPVNVHAYTDRLRVAEHEELLLPRRALLRAEQRVQEWQTAADLARPKAVRRDASADGSATNVVRTGAVWERHLVTDPHSELRKGPSPIIEGAQTLLATGHYDYYHYRVDSFKDDGWGCAYRSLQTILSWFQHEGMMTAPMPSLREIQQILSVVDPDKVGKRGFVGSNEWIGSFEIMMVLQHFVPGLECTIKRLESAAELDSDPGIQGMLYEHFKGEKACPVMIGGSSYAHTILGVHMNVGTTEAQYLILDPHYSANPTNLKTAVNKGYVGWKEASKFFEASQWYNVCIPRVDVFDPR